MNEDELWIRQEFTGRVIVLIHGIGATDPQQYWNQYIQVLLNDQKTFVRNFDIFLWGYPTHRLPKLAGDIRATLIDKTLTDSAPAIKELGFAWDSTYQARFREYQEVILICHSMGGLVVKSWITNVLASGDSAKLDKLRHISFYGTPHQGTSTIAMSAGNKQLEDMKLTSQFISEVSNNWFYHVVHWKENKPDLSTSRYNRYIPHLVIAGINDIVVPVAFATIPGMETWKFKGNHSKIIHPKDARDPLYETWHHDLEETLGSGQIASSKEQKFPDCPYRGLSAFREEDALFFFGREVSTELLIAEVKRKSLIAVIGPSGSGKSSVVFAGLIPHLRREGWIIASFRPTECPFHSLAASLLPLLEPQLSEVDLLFEIKKLSELLMQGSLGLSDVIESIIKKHNVEQLLLVADQFEELYTLCQEEGVRQHFLDELLLAIRGVTTKIQGKSNFKLVITLRADFLGFALSYRPLADALQDADLKLGPMNDKELRSAIERPPHMLSVKIEAGLTDRILDAISQEPGHLPLLEFALTQLWNAAPKKGSLTHEAYDEVGGVKQALAIYAESIYRGLSEEEQRRAEHIFVQLVRPGEGTEDTRRRAKRIEIGLDNWSLVSYLADKRLVVTGQDNVTGEETVELVHEALISGWESLYKWMEKDRAFRIWQENIRPWLYQWQSSNYHEDALLRGALLVAAEDWMLQRPNALSPMEQEFIRASRARQEHEVQHLTGLVEEAQRQREIALARQLGAQAELLRNQQSDLLERSVLLSLESMKRFPTLEARYTLYQGLSLLRKSVACLTHEDTIRMVVFSPDGRHLATASDDSTARIWNATTGELVFSITHKEPVKAVVFSHDGRYVATASDDHTVEIWEMASGQQRTLITLEDCARAATFSPNGDYIATACDDGSVEVWNTISGDSVARINHEEAVNGLTFSLDGHRLATASWDTTVKITEAINGHEVMVLPHDNGVLSVAYSPDEQHLITSTADNFAYIWNVSDKSFIKLRHEGVVNAVVFSRDNRYVATGSWDYTACVWEALSGRLVTKIRHAGSVNAVAFSPDGRYIATASDDRTAAVWETTSGNQVARMIHSRGVKTVAFSPDSAHVVTASDDGTAKVWETAANHLFIPLVHEGFVHTVTFNPLGDFVVTSGEDKTARVWTTSSGRELLHVLHQDVVNVVVVSPNGKYVVTASHDKSAIVWDIHTGKKLYSFRHAKEVYDVAVSPNGEIVITASWDGTAKVWQLPTGRELATLSHEGLIYSVTISSDGNYAATASWDGTAKVWQLPVGRLLATLHHKDKVKHVAFSRDGGFVATASDDRTSVIWEMVSDRPIRILQHEGIVDFVAFSPDSRYVATASADNNARVWNIAGELISRLTHEQAVFSIAWSPSGHYVATASNDKTAGVWEASSAQQIARLNHRDYVYRVAFSPDERYIATASKDGTAKIWLWRPDDLINSACQYLSRNLSLEEWQQYIGNEPYRYTCPAENK